jgi:TamB, inner membrane protein subunit of TAM complex
MKLQVIKNRAFKWLKKTFLYLAYTVVIFLLLSFILLQLPATQKTLIDRYTSIFSKISGFEVTYNSVYIIWWDRLEIEGLIIKDPAQNDMIRVERLEANFQLSALLKNKNVNIDGVTLEEASVNLVKIEVNDSLRDLNINLFINEINKLASSGSGGGGAKVNIGEIVIHKTHFALHDPDKQLMRDVFDYNHIRLAIDEAEAQNFKVIGDTIEFNMNSLIAVEENAKLTVHNFSSFFRISQSAMEFYKLQARIGNSFVSDTLVFKYNALSDLNDFNNKVTIHAALKNTVIAPEDLSRFAYGNKLFDQPLHMKGKITGKISRLFYQNMEVGIGQTTLKGKLELDGLPSLDETFINLDVKDGNVSISNLAFLFPANVYDRLKALGKFRLNGKFTGFIDDFVANGDFNGSFGQIKSDINLKIDKKYIDRSSFAGSLALNNFNLGLFLADTTNFQRVTLAGRVKGKGLTKETADFNLIGEINSIGIRKYNYQNIVTDARFAKELFNGKLIINDPNLQFTADGSVNIRKGEEIIKIKATLDTLFADQLGLTKQPLFIHTQAEVDIKGLKLDSLFGHVVLQNTFIKYQDESLELDSIYVRSMLADNQRNLLLRSSYADADLVGDFYYSTLFNDLPRLFKEFQLNVKNDKKELARYYSKKTDNQLEYFAAFTVKLNNINPLLKLSKTDVTISHNTIIEGKFSNGITSSLQAFSQIDTVSFNGKYFYENELEFSGSKIRDSTAALVMFTIQSEKQKISNAFKTANLFSEIIWDKDHIDFNLDFDQDSTDNFIRLQSEIDFLNDSTRIKILPTRIKILKKEWQVSQENYSLIKNNEWAINNLELNYETESIRLNGFISDNPAQSLNLTLTNLNLDILNSISTSEFGGIVNGKLEARDVYRNLYLQNELYIKDLVVDDFLIGSVTGSNIWNQEEKRFDINFTIDRLEKRTLTLQGYYNPEEKKPLHVIATLEKTNIKIIEPFLKGIFSQMDGTLSGLYTIEGTFTEPLIQGDGNIENGKIMIDYLKTLYTFNGELNITPKELIFENFTLYDALRNKGNLDGYLTHRNFSKFRINLNADFSNFQVLNTTAKDNSLFYGQAYSTGNLNILGPLSNMKISATARTSKNTRIFIPISGGGSVEKSEFITFVNFKDSTQNKINLNKKKQAEEPSGITMDLNIDITPDAYAEIIFDIKAGDIIRGYGNGDIKLQLDTKGEFNMFGLYEFVQGNYNFTLFDIINKEFNITKGSRISWYGDPYAGQLNLNATYRQLTSLSPILSNQVSEEALTSPQIRRKYPVEVLLNLDGPMLSPQILFDIVAKDLPDNVVVEGEPAPVRLKFSFDAWKAQLNEQELKRQVFSLIMLRRLSPPDAFSTSGSLYNSVSELLSNQLSYWLTQVDQNLEINIDLGSLDQEAFNTFQLRLSYSFLNGRLRITRDGTFSNQYNQTQVASMLGDWTVDYLLTPDGKFKVKMYSRSNINTVTNSLGTQAAITTGISLLHTQSFNQVKDLLKVARDKRKEELETTIETEEDILEQNDLN